MYDQIHVFFERPQHPTIEEDNLKRTQPRYILVAGTAATTRTASGTPAAAGAAAGTGE